MIYDYIVVHNLVLPRPQDASLPTHLQEPGDKAKYGISKSIIIEHVFAVSLTERLGPGNTRLCTTMYHRSHPIPCTCKLGRETFTRAWGPGNTKLCTTMYHRLHALPCKLSNMVNVYSRILLHSFTVHKLLV